MAEFRNIIQAVKDLIKTQYPDDFELESSQVVGKKGGRHRVMIIIEKK